VGIHVFSASCYISRYVCTACSQIQCNRFATRLTQQADIMLCLHCVFPACSEVVKDLQQTCYSSLQQTDIVLCLHLQQTWYKVGTTNIMLCDHCLFPGCWEVVADLPHTCYKVVPGCVCVVVPQGWWLMFSQVCNKRGIFSFSFFRIFNHAIHVKRSKHIYCVNYLNV
jgi:hypothetical protein